MREAAPAGGYVSTAGIRLLLLPTMLCETGVDQSPFIWSALSVGVVAIQADFAKCILINREQAAAWGVVRM